MKKIISSLLVISILILSLCVNVFANNLEESYNVEHYTHLLNLGLIDSTDEFDANYIITRGQFAQLVLKLNNNPIVENVNLTFSDLKKDDENYKYIATCISYGLMSGYSDNTFKANNPITIIETVKVYLSMLNYDIAASYKGGYPLGYQKIANEINLIKGCDISEYNSSLNNKLMVTLTYNLLMSYCNIINGVSNEELVYKKDDITFLEKYLKLVPIKGIVMADKYTYIKDVNNLIDNQILIENKIYKLSEYISGLVGKHVEVFYSKDNNLIKSLVISQNNKETIINIKDFESYSNGVLSYSNDKEKIIDIKINNQVKYIYNNKFILDYDLNDLIKIKCGDIKFLDNNDDKKFDLIFINNYDNYVVSGVFSNKTIQDKINIDKKLDLSGENKEVVITNTDNNIIDFSQIKQNDTLSILENDEFIFVYVNSNCLSGIIESYWDDSIKIGTKDYKLSSKIDVNTLNITPGAMVNLYFDNYNYVCYIELSGVDEFLYGYLVTGAVPDSDYKPMQAKLFLPTNQFAIYNFADKYKVNDIEYKTKVIPNALKDPQQKFIRQPILYKVNQNNEIKEVKTAKDSINENEDGFFRGANIQGTTYSPSSKSFGGIISINNKTVIMQVPKNENDIDEKNYKIISIDKLPNIWYFVESYQYSKNNSYSDVIIMKGETFLINFDTPMAVCVDKTTAVNSQFQEAIKIKYLLNNKYEELYIDETKFLTIDKLTKGDVFRFEADENKEMTDFQHVYDVETDKWLIDANPTDTNYYGSYRMCYGYVARVKDDLIRVSYDKNFINNSQIFNLEFHNLNNYKITLIEKNESRVIVREGKKEDINLDDKVIITMRSGNGRNIFVIKDII